MKYFFSNCYIVLPITILAEDYYFSKNKANNLSKVISKKFFTPLITSLNIGSPQQTIPLLIKPKNKLFYI